MEELVGHRVEREGAAVLGLPPSGGAVRLVRMPPAEADALVAVLTAAAGDHVEALLDIGTAVNGDAVLVLPALPTALGDLLTRGIAPGEAVTILVPIAGVMERLHQQGVVHGSLGVQAIRFDPRGAPVLTRFELAVRRQAVGGSVAGAFDAAIARDDDDLRSLAVTVLRAAGAAAGPLAAELAAGHLATAALPAALFALAEPALVQLSHEGRQQARDAMPGRLVPPAAPAPVPGRMRRLRRLPRLPDGWGPRAAGIAVVTRLHGVRRRVWGAAAVSLALLALALVLLPGRGAAGEPGPRGSAPPTRSAAARPRVTPAPPATGAARTVPVEPLAAARALLAARRSCLASGSIRCLARLESAGSPIAIVDAAATTGAVEPVAVPEAALRLRSTAGGTAVLTAGDRTVLLLEEPDGWRLRDAIGPPTTRSTARSGDAKG